MDKLKLMKITNEVRKDIVTAVHSAKAGHPGGSLSAAPDIRAAHCQRRRSLLTCILRK